MRKILLAAALIGLAIGPALAQTSPQEGTPARVRGSVDKLDGQTLVVKSREGPLVTIALAPNFTVSGVVKKSVADIKSGDFVASTSVKGADGKLQAIEVHFLPEALRGVIAEAQFPSDLVPDGIMTNATVTGIATAPQGPVLKVSYKGNETEVVVPPAAPVVAYVPGDATLLKPGVAVYVMALKKPDGSLTAARVTAEKDGVKPPM